MRSHESCTHAQTPTARRTCREIRRYQLLAEELHLEAQVISRGNYAQLIIWNPRDELNLRLVWTRTYSEGGYQFMVISPRGVPKLYQSASVLVAWMNVMARRA